jgi:hypothetical protein
MEIATVSSRSVDRDDTASVVEDASSSPRSSGLDVASQYVATGERVNARRGGGR